MTNSAKATSLRQTTIWVSLRHARCACPRDIAFAQVRLDAAGYQTDIFNDCEDTGKRFAIGARLDRPTLKAIAAIPEAAWKHYADCAVAETLHSMNGTKKAFRMIVVRYRR